MEDIKNLTAVQRAWYVYSVDRKLKRLIFGSWGNYDENTRQKIEENFSVLESFKEYYKIKMNNAFEKFMVNVYKDKIKDIDTIINYYRFQYENRPVK